MTSAVYCITGSVCYDTILNDICSLLYYWLSVLRHHSKWHLQFTQRIFTTLQQILLAVTHCSNNLLHPVDHMFSAESHKVDAKRVVICSSDQWLVFCLGGRNVSPLILRRSSVTDKLLFNVNHSSPRFVFSCVCILPDKTHQQTSIPPVG